VSVVSPAGALRPLISLRHLTVRFGATVALDDLSLDVRAGERIAIVGESGCGKTTLLSVVSGLRRPTRGAVERTPGIRLGLLLQDPLASLNPGWTVEQLVGEPLRDRRAGGAGGRRHSRQERELLVRQAMAAVKLSTLDVNRYPSQLSVGQCQRVALARALVAEPDLLLADEPTSALDPSVAAGVLRLIDAVLTATGAALLVVSHDILAVTPLVHRTLVIHQGRVVEDAPPRELLARPQHPATVRLVETARRLAVDGAPAPHPSS
jgi:peptide/nickel transport system ATP-binding protein